MNFELITSNGEKVSCNIVMSFTDDKSGIKYLIYKDGTKNKYGVENILASRFQEKNGEYYISDIETDKEWDMVDEVLAKIYPGDKDE